MFKKFLASNHEFTTTTLEVESFDTNGILQYIFTLLETIEILFPTMIYSFLFIFMQRQLWTKQKVYNKYPARQLLSTNSKVPATPT